MTIYTRETPTNMLRWHTAAAVVHLVSACLITFTMRPSIEYCKRSLNFTGYEYV